MLQDLIVAEERELADVLDGLTAEQWTAPSLCAGWSVAHVVAHLTMPFRYSKPRFLFGMLKARGRFETMSNAVAERDASLPRHELVKSLRGNAADPWKPPGGGYEGALTHDIVHGLDITRPLSIEWAIAPEALVVVLDSAVGEKSRRHFGVDLEGLALRAEDVEWSYGSGPPLAGRATDLILFLSGRAVPAGSFTGGGADMLGGRR
jgi:uncharacterized protein (TIGR03083 family)